MTPLGVGTSHVLGGMELATQSHHTTENSVHLETYKLSTSRVFYLIYLGQG